MLEGEEDAPRGQEVAKEEGAWGMGLNWLLGWDVAGIGVPPEDARG